MNETKKIFKEPEIEIIMLQNTDIITASNEEEEYTIKNIPEVKLAKFGIFK